jgi:hypothetical protein
MVDMARWAAQEALAGDVMPTENPSTELLHMAAATAAMTIEEKLNLILDYLMKLLRKEIDLY